MPGHQERPFAKFKPPMNQPVDYRQLKIPIFRIGSNMSSIQGVSTIANHPLQPEKQCFREGSEFNYYNYISISSALNYKVDPENCYFLSTIAILVVVSL